MIKVKYIGEKKEMPVFAPVGEKPKRLLVKRNGPAFVMNPGEEKELPEDEAKKLVALDPVNFKIVGDDNHKDERPEKLAPPDPDEVSLSEAVAEIEDAKKPRRRSKK